MSLKSFAADVLLGCPGYNELYSLRNSDGSNQDSIAPMDDQQSKTDKIVKSIYEDLYVPGEITGIPLEFRAPVRLYVSPNNPGAEKVVTDIQGAMADLEFSTTPTPEATHFLLYLAHETFVGEAGDRLAEEVRHMMRTNRSIVMLHENDMGNGG